MASVVSSKLHLPEPMDQLKKGKGKKEKSAREPSGSSGWSSSWFQRLDEMSVHHRITVADSDFEPRGLRGPSSILLAQPAFFLLQSFLLFSPKIRGPPGPSPRSATVLPPTLSSPIPIYTPGWREAPRELRVSPKNKTQYPRPGLGPRPLVPESKALTMRPPRLSLRWLKTVSSTFQEATFDGSLLPLFIS